MKGKPPNKAEKLYHDQLCSLVGCIACRIDGNLNFYVSVHHIDGRTKPGAHLKVLPLCAPHHQQDDADPAGRIAVHPNKARFEEKYGRQMYLNDLCNLHIKRVTEKCTD